MKNKPQANQTTKRIIAITTITTMAAAGMANAQVPNATDAQKSIFEQAMSLFKSGNSQEAQNLLSQNGLKTFGFKDGKHGMHGKMKDKHANKKAIHEAIIAGNYALFQQAASSSPLKSISQTTFNQLTPHFQAKKNAEDQIKSILSAAGIQPPQHEGRNSK